MTNPHYPALFSPIELGGHTLRNRITHASIVTQYVVNHAPTEKLLNYYRSEQQAARRPLSLSRSQ